jgi:hypothetical protein
MGYTRIEPEAGGAASLAIPEFDSGLIDEETDARGEQAQRREERGSANEGLNRLWPS